MDKFFKHNDRSTFYIVKNYKPCKGRLKGNITVLNFELGRYSDFIPLYRITELAQDEFVEKIKLATRSCIQDIKSL